MPRKRSIEIGRVQCVYAIHEIIMGLCKLNTDIKYTTYVAYPKIDGIIMISDIEMIVR